jgi:hypothetical protein
MEAGGDEALYWLLKAGVLVVEVAEFHAWYHSERERGKWPSQRSRAKPRQGRATKQTDALRNSVLAMVHDGKWNAETDTIAELGKLLGGPRKIDVPSVDTLARLVDNLFKETGEPGLHRKLRSRPIRRSD